MAMKINKFDVELDVTESTYLAEAIKYVLENADIDKDRRESLEKTLEKIQDSSLNAVWIVG